MATLNVKNFPDRLYQRLRALARRDHRSVAQEVVHLLTRATEQRPRHSILEMEGLGKDLWEKTDVARYLEEERRSWD